MAARSIQASFRMTGAAYNTMFRNLVLEGRWSFAVNELIRCLDGMTVDIAHQILSGQAELAGTAGTPDGIYLVERVDEDYVEEMRSRYAGFTEDKEGRCWAPYAIVTTFGRPDAMDMVRAYRTMEGGPDGIHIEPKPRGRYDERYNIAFRILHYADRRPWDHGVTHADSDRPYMLLWPDSAEHPDTATNLSRETAVLFRRVDRPPLWLEPARTQQAAFEEYLAAGRELEVRGYDQTYRRYALHRLESADKLVPPPTSMELPSRDVRTLQEDLPEGQFINEIDKAMVVEGMHAQVANLRGLSSMTAEQNTSKPLGGVRADVFEETLDEEIRCGFTRKTAEEVLLGERRPDIERYADLRAIILEQAQAGGFVEVPLPAEHEAEIRREYPSLPPGPLRIPRAPLEQWALWRTAGAHLALPWKAVCHQGMKMMMDDPFHSDWMLGAGLELNAMQQSWKGPWGEALRQALYDLQVDIQDEKLGAKPAATLSGRGSVEGTIAHGPRLARDKQMPKPGDILVIPDAGPRWVEMVLAATAGGVGGVITENGGEMAHLVTIARPEGIRMVRVANARTLYPDGTRVTMDCDNRTVRLEMERIRPIEAHPDLGGWRPEEADVEADAETADEADLDNDDDSPSP